LASKRRFINYMGLISIIVAVDENNAIGKDGGMLCHLPGDLKYFKSVTECHTVIMGRKTFESLPKGALPNRRNIVVSRNKQLKLKDAEVVESLQGALNCVRDESEVFIIGGGAVYTQALPFAGKLYITRIHHSFQGADTFFPKIDLSQWSLLSEEIHLADERNKYDYTFQTFVRNL